MKLSVLPAQPNRTTRSRATAEAQEPVGGSTRPMSRLVRLVSSVLNLPIAGVSVVGPESVTVVASNGLPLRSTGSQPGLLCRSCAAAGELLEISNAANDRRFAGDPLVTGPARVLYYVGAPVRNAAGTVIATLWAADTRHRSLGPDHLGLLQELAGDLGRVFALAAAPLDELTGLHDLAYLLELTRLESQWCSHEGRSITACAVEIDTDVRTTAGGEVTLAGDGPFDLQAVGAALTECTWRVADVVARRSANQFAVLLSGTDLDGAEAVCARMLDAVAASSGGAPGRPTATLVATIGSSTVAGPVDPEELFADALVALAEARAEGGDQHVGHNFPG